MLVKLSVENSPPAPLFVIQIIPTRGGVVNEEAQNRAILDPSTVYD